MATSPEKRIEAALVTQVSALTYITANSVSVRADDDQTQVKAAALVNVAMLKARRLQPNYNYYQARVELSCVTHIPNDENDAVNENVYDEVNDYSQALTATVLNTAVNDSEITIDGIVQLDNDDYMEENSRVYVVVFDCYYTYTGALPSNTVAPVASGTGEVGQILSTTNGTWLHNPTFTYQWQADTVNISNAVSSAYTLTTGETDTDVRCVVTGKNAVGSASANSNAISIESSFAALVAEATQPTFTNTSTGSRQSTFSGVADRAANTPDSTTAQSVNFYSSMAAATNLVTTVLTDWTDSGSAVSTEPSSNLFRITLSAGSGTVVDSFASASNNRFFRCQARLVSGTVPASSIATFRAATVDKGTSFDLTTLTSSFQDVDASVTSADATDDFAFVLQSGTCVIEIQYLRATDLTAPAAAFVDGTAAGTAYGSDALTASPTWGSSGTLVTTFIPYGWDSTNQPVSFMRLYTLNNTGSVTQIGSTFWPEFRSWDNASQLLTKGSSAIVADQTHVMSHDWDGTNNDVRWQDEAIDENADTSNPSGSLTVGRSGANIPHGIVAFLIFNRVITDDEYETLRVGLLAAYAELTLK